MKRWLPAPWLSLGIFGGWLLLNQSLAAAQLLLAAVVALVMPLLLASLRPAPVGHYERIAAGPADPTLGIVRSLLF